MFLKVSYSLYGGSPLQQKTKDKTKEAPGELIDGYRNPTNGKINVGAFAKKMGIV